jgi:hypothetical protein
VTPAGKTKLRAALCIVAFSAFVAAGVADPGDGNSSTKSYYYVAGHVFGLGEQQVYVVERTATLTVRYRDAAGTLQSRTFHQDDRDSIAWTIEGIASTGGPILGVSTAAPVATSSASPSPVESATATATATVSPQPSPMLDAQGAGASNGAMGELGAASFLLGSLTSDLPDIGKPWFSTGVLPLKYGVLTLLMNNMVDQPSGDQGSVVLISSTGGCDFQSKIQVKGFGVASLRGGGGATSQSYVESQNRLLLGMTVYAFSHGNANAKGRAGSYSLDVNVAIKLVHYIPGIPVYTGAVGFVPASAYLGNTMAPDTSIYSTGIPASVASPGATNTEFIPPAMQPVTPYPSSLPEVSLPPIPIPQSSDQPVASPPAPPTPTPTPSRYP